MSETSLCDTRCNCGDDPDNLWPDTYSSYDDYNSYDDLSSRTHVACKMCAYLFDPQSSTDELCNSCEPFRDEYELSLARQSNLPDWIEVGEYSYCASCGMNINRCPCFTTPDEGVTSDTAWLEQITEQSPQEFAHMSAFISRRYRAS